MTSVPTKAVEVFYSYAHEDEGLRNKLVEHLSTLRRQGFITEWHDRKIVAGADWALERHHAREACVIPIILRPTDRSNTPFARLEALPTDGKPITTWRNRDQAFLDIAKGIRKVIEELASSPPRP